MGLLAKLKKKKSSNGPPASFASSESIPQSSTLKQAVLQPTKRPPTRTPHPPPAPATPGAINLAAIAAKLQHSHAHGTTACCCTLLSAAVTGVNATVSTPGATLPRHDVFVLGQEAVFVLQHGRECCRYTAAGLMASLSSHQAERTVLHQLYSVPALAHALSVSAVHNARPVAVALGNLALEQHIHASLLAADGVLESLVGILLWQPSAREQRLVPPDVVDACRHDALYALGALAASPNGTAALLEFDDVASTAVELMHTSTTSSDTRHAALQLLQRMVGCGAEQTHQQLTQCGGVVGLCHVVEGGGCGNGGRRGSGVQGMCVVCARGALGVLSELELDDVDKLGIARGSTLHALMACLTHSDSAIQRDAALVLSNVATHDACRTLLLQEPTLVPCLQAAMQQQRDADVLAALLQATTSLAASPQVKADLIADSAVSMLVTMLQHPSPRVHAAAAYLVAQLAQQPDGPRALVAAGALLPLVTHLNVRDAHHPYHPTAPRGGHDTSAASGQQQSCEASLQALCTMSADVQVAARLLQVEGVLDAVMQLVGHAEAQVASLALALLVVLAEQADDTTCFAQARAFPLLLPCLEHEDPQCREHALFLVAALVQDAAVASRLLNSNVLPMLARCLAVETNPATQLEYLALLDALVLRTTQAPHEAHQGDTRSVNSRGTSITPTWQRVVDAGKQLVAVKGLVPALLKLLGQVLELPDGAGWQHAHAIVELLRGMERNARAAQGIATCRHLNAIVVLFADGTPDATRFAAIKLIMALAKHKDPVISQGIIVSGLLASLLDMLRVHQAQVVHGKPGAPQAQTGPLLTRYIRRAESVVVPGGGAASDVGGKHELAGEDQIDNSSEDTHLRDHETSGGFAFPTPPLSNPPTRPTSPPSSRPSTLHDLHLMAAASQAASEVASLPGDGFIHSHNGTPRDMEDGGTTVVEEEEVEEDAAAFWQHCVLVALYNICLDDDACQEAFLQGDGAQLLLECLHESVPNSALCVANFVAALAVDYAPNQKVLRELGFEDAMCALYSASADDPQLLNVIAVALWELWDHHAPASLPHDVDIEELLIRKDELMGAAAAGGEW